MIIRVVATRFGPVSAIAMLLVLPLLAASGVGAEAPPQPPALGPQVTLSLSPPTGEANVSHTEYGIVDFDGTVRLDRPPVSRVVVTLNASMITGWGCSCAPALLAFSSNAPQNFVVTVFVPPGTLASIVGDLWVFADATGTGFSSSNSANATVTVQPYYQLTVRCESPTLNITAGGKDRFKVDIQNQGNDNDSFDIKIDNEKELRAAGWSFGLILPTIPFVPPGASMPVYVEVEAPQGLSNGNNPVAIDLSVTSRRSLSRGPIQTSDIVLHANLKGGLDDPFSQMIIIAVVAVAAVAAAIAWRWRKKRGSRAQDVEEAPPT